MEKLPPIAKIYEAYSCLADERILLKEQEAIVKSSDFKKSYTVKWNDNNYSSTDNASFWQGYPGYPIIAVLMLQEKITYNKDIIPYFKNINWHDLNEKYKRDYEKAVEQVLQSISFDSTKIIEETEKTYKSLIDLPIHVKKKI